MNEANIACSGDVDQELLAELTQRKYMDVAQNLVSPEERMRIMKRLEELATLQKSFSLGFENDLEQMKVFSDLPPIQNALMTTEALASFVQSVVQHLTKAFEFINESECIMMTHHREMWQGGALDLAGLEVKVKACATNLSNCTDDLVQVSQAGAQLKASLSQSSHMAVVDFFMNIASKHSEELILQTSNLFDIKQILGSSLDTQKMLQIQEVKQVMGARFPKF